MAKKAEQENAPDVLGQFNALKQKHPDAMLLFRKGDFYEMYKEDAVKAATVLSITLTSRTFRGAGQIRFVSLSCLGRVSAQTDTLRAESGHL